MHSGTRLGAVNWQLKVSNISIVYVYEWPESHHEYLVLPSHNIFKKADIVLISPDAIQSERKRVIGGSWKFIESALSQSSTAVISILPFDEFYEMLSDLIKHIGISRLENVDILVVSKTLKRSVYLANIYAEW